MNTWTVFLGREVTFLAVPIGRGRVYCYCDRPAEGVPPLGRGQPTEYLAELLSGFGGPGSRHPRLARPETARPCRRRSRRSGIDSWRSGSVLLIGDAAHATSPNMAEGAAMALEDGLVLAECLASEQRSHAHWRPSRPACPTHAVGPGPDPPPGPHPRPAARLRNFVLRRWGRKIFHHNYRPLREVP